MRAIVSRPSNLTTAPAVVSVPEQPASPATAQVTEQPVSPVMEPVVTPQAAAVDMAPVVPGVQPVTEYGDYYIDGVLASYSSEGVRLSEVPSRPESATKVRILVIALGDVVLTVTSNLTDNEEPVPDPLAVAPVITEQLVADVPTVDEVL